MPEIVVQDREVADEAEADQRLGETLAKISEIRREYDLPASCE